MSRSSNSPTIRVRPSRPSTRRASASPSICPSLSTRVQPAISRISTEASAEAVATIGSVAPVSRTVKVTFVLAVSLPVVATSTARSTRAAR